MVTICLRSLIAYFIFYFIETYLIYNIVLLIVSSVQQRDSGMCAVLCLVAQLCWTLCDPMGCSPPGSSVHGILQARILEWVAMPSSKGSSQRMDRTQVSCKELFSFSIIGYYKILNIVPCSIQYILVFIYFLKFLKLEYNCFTMSC